MRTIGLVICVILTALGIAAWALRWLWIAMIAVSMLFFAYSAARAADASRPAWKITDPYAGHSNPWLLSWIPATCCVTNDCCWEISERELESLPDDQWRVRSTGEVKGRTAYSPDGKTYRCACDFDKASGKWIRHQGANTRCIFPPSRLY